MNDQMVTDYIIVRSSGSIGSLVDSVTEKIKEGFQPLGGVSMDGGGGCTQAMVKYEVNATKQICARCVGEAFLKALIDADGIKASCSYCENESNTFTIEELADRIETAFDDHYERTPTEPEGFKAAMHNDSESSYEWEREGE